MGHLCLAALPPRGFAASTTVQKSTPLAVSLTITQITDWPALVSKVYQLDNTKMIISGNGTRNSLFPQPNYPSRPSPTPTITLNLIFPVASNATEATRSCHRTFGSSSPTDPKPLACSRCSKYVSALGGTATPMRRHRIDRIPALSFTTLAFPCDDAADWRSFLTMAPPVELPPPHGHQCL
ncbi:hypothetical protein E2562_017613 [Oryza meyeriana var. granulata]|uniref:Uncharacterized protein n=1 Tax=Oryza meyeriana var. granulata TaxID=110450 RepID=A0A6G1BZ26_9ORYZ|nr:hypothetical protein E2562_017613 [Oryza meyeriana var. granulata]